MKTLNTKSEHLLRKLFKLELCGKYDEAFAELRHIWEDTASLPDVKGFDVGAAAEIILRCGSLIGFFGYSRQIPNSQEKSKNLLSEVRQRFIDLNNIEKIAECENYLALSYWRTGELIEANVLIDAALSHNLPNSSQVRLNTFIVKCTIDLYLARFKESISLLKNLENDFIIFGSDSLKGDFYNRYAIFLKEVGETSEAIKKYELAKYFFQKSGRQLYLGIVENNLAGLYKESNKFIEAHTAIDNAIKVFKQIKDKTRQGFALDSKAQIYVVQRKYIEALKLSEKATAILRKSENESYLIETLSTKAKILIYLDDLTGATFCLFDAVVIARTKISEEYAEKLVKEFDTALREKTLKQFADDLKDTEVEFENNYNLRNDYNVDGTEDEFEKLEKFLNNPLELKKFSDEHAKNLSDDWKYDVALSFASEDRSFVDDVFNELIDQNISVFYDRHEGIAIDSWGEDFTKLFDRVFRKESKFVVIFVSAYYARKSWTQYEFRCALAKALEVERTYILPARFDDTELSGLPPTIAFIDLRQETARTFADKIIKKIRKS